MKSTASNMVSVGIVAILMAFFGYWIVWPLNDNKGVVREGQFRGLEIGTSKSEVALRILSANRRDGKLKLTGYEDAASGEYCSVFVPRGCGPIEHSNVWYLAFPSIHNERIEITFDHERVVQIRYSRSLFDQ